MRLTRRSFVATAGMAVAAPQILVGQSQRVFKFAVVGCGGRGTGAVRA